MATLLGNNYMLWVETATAGTYALVKGQGTLSETRSQQKIDTSSKDTTGYGTGAYGNVDLSQSLDIRVTLPDASGYTRLETLANAQPPAPFNIQVRKNGAAAVLSDAIFAASVFASITSRAFNKDGTVDVKADFMLAAAPTVDVLA